MEKYKIKTDYNELKRLEIQSSIHQEQTKIFIKNLNIKKNNLYIADYGCGMGYTTELLSSIFGEKCLVTAIDNNIRSLDEAKLKFKNS